MKPTQGPVMPVETARQLVGGFALVALAQKSAEDPGWAQALTHEPFRRRLARWIIALEDEAPRVLACAAHYAHTRREGGSLATVLRIWLGFAQADHQDGDRHLALGVVLDRPSWMGEAEYPLAYLRRAVKMEARRIARDAETGGRQWERISLLAPSEDEDAPDVPSIESLAQDEVHAEERFVRRDESMAHVRGQGIARPRPALDRVLRVAAELRAAGLSAAEDRLLGLLEVGIPPADAERLSGCEHTVYVNLLQKARRRAA